MIEMFEWLSLNQGSNRRAAQPLKILEKLTDIRILYNFSRICHYFCA